MYAMQTRGYINLAMAINVTSMFATSLHGIVGQTTPDRAPVVSLLPPELQYQWLGEGSEDDYVVSSLFGTDSRCASYSEDYAVEHCHSLHSWRSPLT